MYTPEALSFEITKKIADFSFKFFRNKKFRHMIEFGSLEEIEQDRIFNEILVSGLCLSILMFRMGRDMTEGKKRGELNELQMEMQSTYSSWLKELGTEKELADEWKKLIKMRCEEYENDYKKLKRKLVDPKKGNPWIYLVSFGGYHHIRRGKVSEDDPLFVFFMKWVGDLSVTILGFLKR